MTDVFPVDYTTDVGRVRKRIPDVILLDDPADPTQDPSFIFSDEEIQSFLDDETLTLPTQRWHVLRAAAWAMIALANNENLIQKVIISQDLSTNGAAQAAQFIAAAKLVFAQADSAENTAAAGEVMYAVDFQPYDGPYGYEIIRFT